MNASRRQALCWALTLAASTTASAQTAAPALAAPAAPTEASTELPGARLQGRSTLRFLGLRIYEARLWVGALPVAADWDDVPYALELEYARDFKGEQIAERSLSEMRRQGEIAADKSQRWTDLLKQLIPDVKAGDRITGVHRPGQGLRLFHNGKLRGEARDTEFARWFFGIWLSPRTSEPALRSTLLGQGS